MNTFINTFFALLLITTISFTGMFATQGRNMQSSIKALAMNENVPSLNRAPAVDVMYSRINEH